MSTNRKPLLAKKEILLNLLLTCIQKHDLQKFKEYFPRYVKEFNDVDDINDSFSVSTMDEKVTLFGIACVYYDSDNEESKKIVSFLLEETPYRPDLNKPPNTFSIPLLYACRHNKIELVQLLLDQKNISLDARSQYGNTALHIACALGGDAIVELLLKQKKIKQILNSLNIENFTPLYSACSTGQVKIVRLLINHPHININQQHKDGPAAIHGAAISTTNQEEIIELLCQKGAKIDLLRASTTHEHAHDTALAAAVCIKNIKACKALLKNGADPFMRKNFHSFMPYEGALYGSSEELLSLFNEHIVTHQIRIPDSKTFYHVLSNAARTNNLNLLAVLFNQMKLNKDFSLDFSIGQHPALITAVVNNSVESVKLLLKEGADPNITIVTSSADNERLAKENKIDRDDINRKASYTPLYVAACHQNKVIMELLLENGADPDRCYCSPLDLAMQYRDEEMFELLFEKNHVAPRATTLTYLFINPEVYTEFYARILSRSDIDLTQLLKGVIDIFLGNAYVKHKLEGEERNWILFHLLNYLDDGKYPLIDYIQSHKTGTKLLQSLSNLATKIGHSEATRLEKLLKSKATPKQKTPEMDDFHQASPRETDFGITMPETRSPTSARNYLKQLGLKDEQLDEWKKITREKDKYPLSKTKRFWGEETKKIEEKRTSTWCDGLIKSTDALIQPIADRANCYYYLALDKIKEEGCPAELLTIFQKQSLRFNGGMIKKLVQLTTCTMFVNGKAYSAKPSHEILAHSKARIITFKLKSDDGKSSLYVGGKFLPNGLHENADIKSFEQSAHEINISYLETTANNNNNEPQSKFGYL